MIWAPLWVALIPWAGLVSGGNAWSAMWWWMTAGLWIGWLTDASGRLPAPATALAGWALALSWWQFGTTHLAHLGTGGTAIVVKTLNGVRIIPDGLPPMPMDGLLLTILYVLTAVVAVRWMSGWSAALTEHVSRALMISLSLWVGYGLMQACGMDQFRANIDGKAATLGGTLGNPTLYASALAMSLPLWLSAHSRWTKAVAVAALGLILRCGSASALCAASLVLAWTYWRHARRWSVRVAGVVFLGCAVWSAWPFSQFLNPHGRVEVWQAAVNLWSHEAPQVGLGLGRIWQLASTWPSTHPLSGWQHLHNDWLQVLVELGPLGLALLGWVVVDAIRRFARHVIVEGARWGGMLLASGALALTVFVWHSPLTAFLTLFAYSRIITEGA